MAVTLRQLYEGIRTREEMCLIAGECGLDREVRWLHMVEGIMISDFLEGDELAFTTGVALNSPEELMELVQLNYQKNTSGMVINIGPYIPEISQEILDFANAHDFPIFSVPWRVHMANIMRQFSMEITMDAQKNMEFSSALKNAVYFPNNEELYVPTFLKYGYKKEWSYCIAVMQMCDKMHAVWKGVQSEYVWKRIQHVMRRYHDHIMIQNIDYDIVFFCHNLTEEKIKEVLREAWKELSMTLPEKTCFFAGIGRSIKGINGIGKCYSQAQQVKKLQKKKSQKNEVLTYNELGIYKVLLSVDETGVLEEYYDEYLGALERYDHINETDYYYFLKQYFAYDCSTQNVAKALHLHRNSVTYKLHKCEEIIGKDLSGQKERAEIMLAFMLREIQ